MRKPQIVVAEFQHETNCFCPNKAGQKEYEDRYLKESDDVISFFKGTRSEIGGMLEASEKEGFEIFPVIAASATPTGLTTREIFEYVKGRIVGAISGTKEVDGVLLSLHGAMVSETEPDSEGALLKAIRNAAGPEMPIVATLDLHANVTEEMVENADVLFPYETYPHIDAFERGYEATECLAKMILVEISPIMKLRRIPILAQPIETTSEPHVGLFEEVRRWEEDPKVINVAVLHGFPWSDIAKTGISTIAVTDGDGRLSQTIVDSMAKMIWERRDRFKRKFLSADEAVKEAIRSPAAPVVIADAADNPGGGGTGDCTFLLRALVKAGAKNAGLAFIPDLESVEQAINSGVGSLVELNLGGKLGPKEMTGGPLPVKGIVKTISDGQFLNKGPMMRGVPNNMGRTVVLDIDGIEVIIAERRMQALDAEIFRRVGIEPTEKKIIGLKSAVHFKASFGPIAGRILDVDTPGYHTMNFESLSFRNVSRPIYPLDKDFTYAI